MSLIKNLTEKFKQISQQLKINDGNIEVQWNDFVKSQWKIIDEVKSFVSKWSSFAKDTGVSAASSKLIDSAIAKIIKENF